MSMRTRVGGLFHTLATMTDVCDGSLNPFSQFQVYSKGINTMKTVENIQAHKPKYAGHSQKCIRILTSAFQSRILTRFLEKKKI